MKNETQKILLSPYFLLGLFLLLLNDFFLKQQFHNFLTGKLSDFTGLFVFPLFFAAFFPKRKSLIYALTFILFIFWKSPFSQSFIDFWNSFAYFKIERIVDYSDLFALSVLPISFLYFVEMEKFANTFKHNSIKRISLCFVILLSVFAFTATSFADERSIDIEGEYNFKLNHSDIENILKQNNKVMDLEIKREIDIFPPEKYPDLKTDPNDYFANFTLNQKVCDSNVLRFYFFIHEEKGIATIKSATINLRCGEFAKDRGNSNVELVKAIKKYQPELQTIFEREVIEKLRQNSPQ